MLLQSFLRRSAVPARSHNPWIIGPQNIATNAHGIPTSYPAAPGLKHLYGKSDHQVRIDPKIHFAAIENYWNRMTWQELLYHFGQNWHGNKLCFAGILLTIACIVPTIIIEWRREPLEIFMDREEYFRDYHSRAYGVYFDHHAFSHQLCKRRAKKWQYEDRVDLSHH